MSEKPICVKCGKPLEAPATGRKPIFCGSTCRGAAAYELRRLDRRIATLEGKVLTVREKIAESLYDPSGDEYKQKLLVFYREEIAACEARLSVLLAAGGRSPQ